MEKVRGSIYLLCIFLCLISLSFSLIAPPIQRDFFYYASYIALIGMLLERKNIKIKSDSIFYSIILIGIIKVVWAFFLYGYDDFGHGNVQIDAGKKLVVGGLLAMYINQYLKTCSYKNFNYQRALLFVFSLAFVFTTAYAFYQILNGMERVEFSTNRATIAAYIYSTMSLLLVYLFFINEMSFKYRVFFSFLVILISFIIIMMTGTRAVMFSYPFLVVFVFLFHFRRVSFNFFVVFSCLFLLACYISYGGFIKPKIEQTKKELQLYNQGIDSSSLGSRFSLWVVGGEIFLSHPYGNTLENRRKQAEEKILDAPENQTALIYIDTHLHNELLESASLQGVVGLLSVLAFYLSMLIRAIRRRLTPLLIVSLCMIVYGTTDVLLISPESIMFFILTLAFFSRFPVSMRSLVTE